MPAKDLLHRNRHWANRIVESDPTFFRRLAADHSPKVVFVGCSDARVPVDVVTESDLGDLFVHRNIANQVMLSDASLAAGLQYAIDVLGVDDVVVCGHHGCGGCRAAMTEEPPAYVDAWLGPLRLLARLHADELAELSPEARVDRLAELNVHEQVACLARHPSVKAAWAAGRPLRLHGWVFELSTGRLRAEVMLGPALHLEPDAPAVVEDALVG
jgi:carbonic anhydrase